MAAGLVGRQVKRANAGLVFCIAGAAAVRLLRCKLHRLRRRRRRKGTAFWRRQASAVCRDDD